MNTGKYGFLPWVRTGLTGHIQQQDTLGTSASGSSERAAVTAVLNTTVGNVTKTLHLVGPGDITAIDQKVILRREPQENTFFFEANYLPAIEFFEEDFPWRYTPAVANTQKQLRPWLALIVLKDGEFTILPPFGDGLPVVLNITVPLAGILHPADEHWGWAHVQANKPTTTLNTLKADLALDPNMGFSRLLSSRMLEAGVSYTAFLIPAFETGRLAGLNKDTTTTDSLAGAWDLNPPSNGPSRFSPGYFPVYHQWRFGTSASSDFESTVDALVPNVTAANLGGTTVNIDHSGMGLDSLFKIVAPATAPLVNQRTVEMEAALRPPNFAPASILDISATRDSATNTIQNLSPLSEYATRLRDLLNLSATLKFTNFAPVRNPFFPDKSFRPPGSAAPLPTATVEDDPVVLPPLYGQWHAGQRTVNAASPSWFQQVNLDPRYRIAAGLGARVVRENQTNFLEVAWKQIGEVLQVNDRITKAVLAQQVSEAIYDKHIIGDVKIVGAQNGALTPADKFDTLVKVSTSALRNIRIGTGPNAITIPKAALQATLTETTTTPQFRKAIRSKAPYVRKFNETLPVSATQTLIGNINAGAVKPVQLLQPPIDVEPAADLLGQGAASSIQSHNNNTNVSGVAGGIAVGGIAAQLPPAVQSVYYGSFEQLLKTVDFYTSRQNSHANTTPATLDPGVLVTNIANELDPAIQIPERTWQAIRLQYQGVSVGTLNRPLQPITAYPIIDTPMYTYLEQLSTEYILPHIDQYPNNTVTVLQPNNRFIESYLLGANHEFAKELLWQEYPTDQRGSYFRQFWNISDTVVPASVQNASEYLYDVSPLHTWLGDLGSNRNTQRLRGSEYLMLVIRGELLQKFPNTLIYMHKAFGAAPTPSSTTPRSLAGNAVGSNGQFNPDVVKLPTFKAYIQPDIAIVGFDIMRDVAHGGDDATNPGWFFVFQERPGQLRFGLDAYKENAVTSLANWDQLNWKHMGSTSGGGPMIARMNNVSAVQSLNNLPNQTIHWGSNAAENAWILLQQPVKMAIHASDLI